MSLVEIGGLVKRYGAVTALAGVDLSVPAGTLTAVIGPSGCGKTTLLRCLAGFEPVDGGEIAVDGARMSAPGLRVPPHRRGVAVVPQEGALFPHLDVRRNVGYGLDRTARRSGRVDEALELVGLAGLGDRMPHQLSGGQQQRVAVARALAPRPALILLDEPFAALDAGLRVEVREDLCAALRAAGTTGVLVTHDQDEAMSVADSIALLRDGTVVQHGSPEELYAAPSDPWAARFLGDAVLLDGVLEQGPHGDARVRTPLGELPLAVPRPTGGAGGLVTVLVRPEQVRLGSAGNGNGPVVGTLRSRRYLGHSTVGAVRLADGAEIRARRPSAELSGLPDEVAVRVEGPVRAWPRP